MLSYVRSYFETINYVTFLMNLMKTQDSPDRRANDISDIFRKKHACYRRIIRSTAHTEIPRVTHA